MLIVFAIECHLTNPMGMALPYRSSIGHNLHNKDAERNHTHKSRGALGMAGI